MKSAALTALLVAQISRAQQAPDNCYAQSKDTHGVTGKSLFSNKSQLLAEANVNHRLALLEGCRTSGQRLNRLTIRLEDTKTGKLLELESAGQALDGEDCKIIVVDQKDFIDMLEVDYDTQGVTGVQVGTRRNQSFMLGRTGVKTEKFDFKESVQLTGFYGETGAKKSIISNLGAIISFTQCIENSLIAPKEDSVSSSDSAQTPNSGGQEVSSVDESQEITDPEQVSSQFISYKPVERQQFTREDSRDTDEPDVTETTTKEEGSMIPIIGGAAAVVILILVICVMCCFKTKKKNKQRSAVQSERSIGHTTQTSRQMVDFLDADDESHPPTASKNEMNLQSAVQGPFSNDEISVDDQNIVSPRTADLADLGTAPEVHHPSNAGLEVIQEQNELTNKKDSDIIIQEESLHPPPAGIYHEEESSIPAINLNQGLQQQEVKPSGLLPDINKSRGIGSLFAEQTPDTAGVGKRRFQEIIDSDDETNGNGSRVQRVQKKFKNARDTFGGDESSQKIDFPITENEGSASKEDQLKLAGGGIRIIHEDPAENLTSGKNTGKSQNAHSKTRK